MDEITESCLGKMLDSKKNKGEYQPYLANINVRWGSFDLNNLSLMRFEQNENDRYGIKYGDLIMCEGGEPGRCAIWRDELPNMKIQKALHRIRPNTNLVDVEYLYYWFLLSGKNDLLRRHFTETTIKHLPGETLKQLVIDLPDMKIQKNISTVLRSIDKKITVNEKINDNLEQQMHLIFENMMAKAATHKLSGEYTIAQNLATVVTGKEDANFSVPNGKYKFFTCSNTPLSCDEYVFDSSSILIAGNGDFNVKHYSGKFNAYQRTYVLTPDKKYFGLLYLASLYRINSFKSRSSGSIVKFITKSDVENIPVFIPNDRFYLQELNKLIYLQEQNKLENELLVNLRDWLLPMLMNGQATISD